MNNTEKLLRAFIDASGYEVEVVGSRSVWDGHREKWGDSNEYKVTKKELPSFQWAAPTQDFGKSVL